MLQTKSNIKHLLIFLTGSDENTGIIDDAAIFLLQFFLNVNIVMVRHLTELKKVFGTITSQTANRICSVVCDLTPLLNEDCIEFIKKQTNADDTDNHRKLWGEQIKCVLPKDEPPADQLALLQDFNVNLLSKPTGAVGKFSMNYEAIQATGEASSKKNNARNLNRSWLLMHVNSDLINTLITMLKSKKTNNELQNELIDLLGFDKFDVIETMFENRKQIIQNIELEDKKRSLYEKAAALEDMSSDSKSKVPVVSSQVVVQSEQELLLKKQVRKDEKRLKTLLNAQNAAYDGDDDGVYENVFDSDVLNVSNIRLQQQHNLLSSIQKQPILSKERSHATPQSSLFNFLSSNTKKVKYPYVFDSQIEARSHIGFISGSKLILPETAKRTDTKLCEEIHLPANTSPPNIDIIDKRVQIKELDEIGQTAFKNVKELNLIQSVVFQRAYHSNDNLLICAPTGAGKTNVAMLTIVHVIKAHTDQGVIHRDQFKIVYVAPMKALAAEMVENFGKRLKPLGNYCGLFLLQITD